ncbi:hypothetical protein [Sulfuriflexus mobilis]|uniref:hypothetical protein n=1 Tax=Sulfuriflexus mobilis TaxID=1811807 RepID=UPI000F8301B1|nr:hypothetical protein [Sulfuriflexus mobilis]
MPIADVGTDRLPADMAQPCPNELPVPNSGRLPDLLDNHIESAELYHRCRILHDSTVKWIRKRENNNGK